MHDCSRFACYIPDFVSLTKTGTAQVLTPHCRLQCVIFPATNFGLPLSCISVMHILASPCIGRHLLILAPTGSSGMIGTKKQSSGSFGGSVNGPWTLMISFNTGTSWPLFRLMQVPIPTGGIVLQVLETRSLIRSTFAEPKVKLVKAELSVGLGV